MGAETVKKDGVAGDGASCQAGDGGRGSRSEAGVASLAVAGEGVDVDVDDAGADEREGAAGAAGDDEGGTADPAR